MSVFFFDSSAVTKKYVRETGTAWVINVFRPKSPNRVYIAEIALVEVISALTRRHRGRTLTNADFTKVSNRFRRNFAANFFKIETNLSVIERAAALAERHALRGYDAVQLASAFNLHLRRQKAGLPPLVFISADNALNAAAQVEGLQIDNPNNHP
ncbi:MAG TPA: type II toxin-antitoxin system VapC family toxin [Pyrinomonadaceae bacterium]|nr:type II toxin-antitoxin system VapC family toxin [Pyrinomonadaceae bacterium]